MPNPAKLPHLSSLETHAPLEVIVLLPLVAVFAKATVTSIWDAATRPAALDALRRTLGASLLVAAINAVLGMLTAWMLVRAPFAARGSSTR